MRRLATALVGLALAACSGIEEPPGGTTPELAACELAYSLSEAGEHKTALDALEGLGRESVICPAAVGEALLRSRAIVDEADGHVEAAFAKRRTGDVAGALDDLAEALKVYPKYYWVQQLQSNLGKSYAEVTELRDRARLKRSRGDFKEALELLESALALTPEDAELVGELARLRKELAGRSFELAKSAEQNGQLGDATRLLHRALDVAPTDPSLRAEIVDFARLLGLELFSSGALTEARDLWAQALSLDSTNQTLKDYLLEVEESLESLTRIQSDDD